MQYGLSLDDLAAPAVAFAPEQAWAREADYAPATELQHFEFSDSFTFG